MAICLAHSSEKMAFKFLQHFLKLNAGLLPNLSPAINPRRFEDLMHKEILPANDFKFQDLWVDLLEALAEQTDRPVTNIIDEHNEMFFKATKEWSPLEHHPQFLREFTKWTGKLSGVCFLF
jgi:hypothetical protein